jgi:hypothetical protein
MRRFVFERLRDADLVALARLRVRFAGEDPQRAYAGLEARALRWHARGRRLKRWFDRLRRRRGSDRP